MRLNMRLMEGGTFWNCAADYNDAGSAAPSPSASSCTAQPDNSYRMIFMTPPRVSEIFRRLRAANPAPGS